MWRKIDFKEHSDSEGRVHWIDLEIDGTVFELNKDDLFTLQLLLDTVYDRMVSTREATNTLGNQQLVKEKCSS